jgi:membrane protease YdiL (CAAX protease family)
MTFDPVDPPLSDSPAPAQPAFSAPESAQLQPPDPYAARLSSALPEDIRVPWGWLDIFLLAVLAIGSTFLFGLLVVLVMAAFGVSPAHIQQNVSSFGLVAVVAQILADLAIIGYLALQMRHRFDRPFWKAVGWRRLDTGAYSRALFVSTLIFGGFFLAVGVALLDSLFPTKQTLPIEQILQDHRTATLFMLTAVFLAPVIEETIFRGYIYPVAARSWGALTGIVFTGTIFGLLHSIQLWGGWWQISFLVLVGIVLTAVRARTGTVVASYIVHASYNALPVLAYLFAALRLHHFPAPQ